MTAPLIDCRGLHKSFGEVVALDGVDLRVERGEVVAIIGPSGSGKTTALRCINWLVPPDRGEIVFDGETMTRGNVIRLCRDIGMVFQHFNLFPHMTCAENVAAGPRFVLGRSAKEARGIALDFLARVHLADKADVYPDLLSGGQKQRVAIARALAMSPKAVLFDEATSALDPELVGQVLLVMRELAESGLTMVVVTHEMDFARDVADRVVFMDRGRVVEQGSPAQIFESPSHARTREFLRAVIDRTPYTEEPETGLRDDQV
jgi:ABC-type polar amino acid transport system ATPase subunit